MCFLIRCVIKLNVFSKRNKKLVVVIPLILFWDLKKPFGDANDD